MLEENIKLARKYLIEDLKVYSSISNHTYSKVVSSLLDKIDILLKENKDLKEKINIKPKERIIYKKR